MFRGWDNYYLLIGSGAAGLIGLLFVVATLNAGRELSTVTRGIRIYLSPVVFHLCAILFVSALTAVPDLAPTAFALLLGTCAAAGLICAGVIATQLRLKTAPDGVHWSDFWFYGVAPALAYLTLAAAAILAATAHKAATYCTAFALLALLLICIRNAWDLVTFLAPRRPGG
jgi:hypothetical protein